MSSVSQFFVKGRQTRRKMKELFQNNVFFGGLLFPGKRDPFVMRILLLYKFNSNDPADVGQKLCVDLVEMV